MSYIQLLAEQTGRDWANIAATRSNTQQKMSELRTAVAEFTAPDTSIVVFGSLARGEFTSGSDIDWTLLLDGSSDPNHLAMSKGIGEAIRGLSKKDVGKEGTFGSLTSSHDLINYIGGEGDTNSNTTRRNLLLLESGCIGADEAYNRVKKNLLTRYMNEDAGLWRRSVTNKLPHFLLNDLARYWRTMTVDYAYKERMRGGGGIPLRKIKLRMSRKLIYVAGLLTCYNCHLGFTDAERAHFYAHKNVPGLVAKTYELLKLSPLEIVACTLLQFPQHRAAAAELFDSYDTFLALLADDAMRDHIEALHADVADADEIYKTAKGNTYKFSNALKSIFLTNESPLGRFTIDYGVF